MICSEGTGAADDHSGIMVLPDSFIPGKALVDQLVLDREILDISVTPTVQIVSVYWVLPVRQRWLQAAFAVPELPLALDDSSADTVSSALTIRKPAGSMLAACCGVRIAPPCVYVTVCMLLKCGPFPILWT